MGSRESKLYTIFCAQKISNLDYERNAAGFIGLFFQDINTKFFKMRIFVAVQELKISFYMQKFSLF